MTKKPALSPRYKSSLEEQIAEQLDEAGISYDYEGVKIPVVIPARESKYTPDFPIAGTNILIEGKGHWGGKGGSGMKQRSADQRHKMILLKEQHPELDVRIVYDHSKTKIYPGSPTTNGQWADDHGFPWADDSTVPEQWIKEIKQLQKRRKNDA